MTNDHGQLPHRNAPPPRLGYIAAGVAVAFFALVGSGVFDGLEGTSGLLLRIGAWLLAAGLAFAAYAVHRRTRPDRLPGIAEDSIGFNIGRLTRRRDGLRSAWLWLLLPLVPGLALLYAGAALAPEVGPLWAILGGLLSTAALVAITAFNVREADRIDAQIADLERQRPPGQ